MRRLVVSRKALLRIALIAIAVAAVAIASWAGQSNANFARVMSNSALVSGS